MFLYFHSSNKKYSINLQHSIVYGWVLTHPALNMELLLYLLVIHLSSQSIQVFHNNHRSLKMLSQSTRPNNHLHHNSRKGVCHTYSKEDNHQLQFLAIILVNLKLAYINNCFKTVLLEILFLGLHLKKTGFLRHLQTNHFSTLLF